MGAGARRYSADQVPDLAPAPRVGRGRNNLPEKAASGDRCMEMTHMTPPRGSAGIAERIAGMRAEALREYERAYCGTLRGGVWPSASAPEDARGRCAGLPPRPAGHDLRGVREPEHLVQRDSLGACFSAGGLDWSRGRAC